MARLGMDVDAVEQAGKDLARQAAQMNAAIGRIDGLIAQAGSSWQGIGAQGYVNEWRTTHRPKMRQTAQACADLATVIARNVAAQRKTSSEYGAVPPMGVARLNEHGSWKRHPSDPPTVRDYVELADAGYSWGRVPPPYEAIDPTTLREMGLSPEDLKTAQGLDAKIMRDPDGKIVVAFGGTEGWIREGAATPDALANAEGVTVGSEQGRQAIDIARKVVEKYGKENVTFTGHSAGGGYSALASAATGARAVTFNAAPVGNYNLLYAAAVQGKDVSFLQSLAGSGPLAELRADLKTNVTNHYTTSDQLLPNRMAEGSHVRVDDGGVARSAFDMGSKLGSQGKLDGAFDGHGLDRFREHYGERNTTLPGPGNGERSGGGGGGW